MQALFGVTRGTQRGLHLGSLGAHSAGSVWTHWKHAVWAPFGRTVWAPFGLTMSTVFAPFGLTGGTQCRLRLGSLRAYSVGSVWAH